MRITIRKKLFAGFGLIMTVLIGVGIYLADFPGIMCKYAKFF